MYKTYVIYLKLSQNSEFCIKVPVSIRKKCNKLYFGAYFASDIHVPLTLFYDKCFNVYCYSLGCFACFMKTLMVVSNFIHFFFHVFTYIIILIL